MLKWEKLVPLYLPGPPQGRQSRNTAKGEVRAVEAGLGLIKLLSVLCSPGALTLISKVTDRANESMEQGVSPAMASSLG